MYKQWGSGYSMNELIKIRVETIEKKEIKTLVKVGEVSYIYIYVCVCVCVCVCACVGGIVKISKYTYIHTYIHTVRTDKGVYIKMFIQIGRRENIFGLLTIRCS